jgi:transcriptional regulator with XRE-family HTH domain
MTEIARDSSARPKESSKALLSGLVRCPDCGSRMFVRAESGRANPDGTLRFRYVCDVKYRKKGGCENSANVKGYELDNLVIEQICGMATGENEFYSELLNTKNTLTVKSRETEKELNAIKRRLSQIERDIQSQTANLRTAPESVKQAIFEDIEALTKEHEERRQRAAAIHADMQDQDNQFADIEKARQTIMDFPRLVKLVDYEGKLQLLRRVLECVIVKDDKVHIFLKGTDSESFFPEARKRGSLCHKEQSSICYMVLCDTPSVAFVNGKILYHASCDMWRIDENAPLAERIRFYRTKGYMNCDTLAELTGISRYSIMRYESGETEPSLDDLKKMAAVLGIEADKLFDDYYRFLDYPYTQKLKEARAEKKITQRKLAEIMGVTAMTAKRWEYGGHVVVRGTWEMMKRFRLF